MNKTFKISAAALLIALAGSAHASTIKIETGFLTAGSQVDAAAYKTVVDAALAIPAAGYGSALPSIYDNISNQILFGGSATNIAFKSTVDFGVSVANAGSWEIRSGVDFGFGGALFVDGVEQVFKTSDMWWAGSYGDPAQFLTITLNLSAGNHTLNLYGLEGCCDGPQQAQFRFGDRQFETFSTRDNLAPVPEPESYAMLLAGLGVMGAIARRRRTIQK
jgi:hypothetical protein